MATWLRGKDMEFCFLFKVTQTSGLCCAPDDHGKATPPSSPTQVSPVQGNSQKFPDHFPLPCNLLDTLSYLFEPDAHSIPFRFLKISENEHGFVYQRALAPVVAQPFRGE